jgi:hypothetical protein
MFSPILGPKARPIYTRGSSIMAVSEMEQIGYEQGMQDMHDYVIKTIRNAIENPALDIIPAKMALQVLLASLNTEES